MLVVAYECLAFERPEGFRWTRSRGWTPNEENDELSNIGGT
jgi:hypothetical protein